MHAIVEMAKQSAADPMIQAIAAKLAAQPDPVKAIFDFAYNNAAYKKDLPDIQGLRYARNSVKNQKANCTGYSILISSLLQNLKVPHRFKVVAYNRGSQKEHIYVVTDSGVILDPVIGQRQDDTDNLTNRPPGSFNKEVPYLWAYYYNIK